jgi:hypothetical protein
MSDQQRSFKGAWSGFGQEMLSGARDVASERVDAAYITGFNEAASLCVALVHETTDALLANITGGDLLSPEEQHVLARMTALKGDMEARVRAFLAQADNRS